MQLSPEALQVILSMLGGLGPHGTIFNQPNNGATVTITGASIPVTTPKCVHIECLFEVRDRTAGTVGIQYQRVTVQGGAAPAIVAGSNVPVYAYVGNVAVPPTFTLALDASGLNIVAQVNNPVAAGAVDVSATFFGPWIGP